MKNIIGKDVRKFLEGYENYIGSVFKFQKTPGDLGKTLSKSDLEELDNMNK